MSRFIRFTAVYVAFVAMLAHAVVPAGWMPNTGGSGGTPLVLCTMDGPIHIVLGGDKDPAKKSPSDDGRHDICPFGSAPHFAAPVAAVYTPAPQAVAFAPQPGGDQRPAFVAPRYSAQSPRAPPLFG